MASEIADKGQRAAEDDAGVRRRGLLRLGTLLTAITGASAISAHGTPNAQAAPGDKPAPNTYVPLAEKGAPSGVAVLDGNAKIPSAQLPDLSATIGERAPEVFKAGTGDQTAALQAFLDALPVGRDAEIRGTVNFTSVTVGVNNVRIRLAPGAVLNKTDSFTDGLVINAAGVTLEGGKITCPAVWDGTNVAWTYAVVHVKETTANNTTIRGITLENVPKVGIGVRSDSVKITDCRIIGNYPVSQWTGVETVHFGITLDPTSAGIGGAGIIGQNHIRGCVQGVYLANYGAGVGYGYNIGGNTFEGCHNHGVYAQSGIGNVVDGNTFFRCQIPVVVTGKAHVVSNNTLYTSGTGAQTDMTGINAREPEGCVIEGNTIYGDSTATNSGIGLDGISGVVIKQNIVKGNVIILSGSGHPCIRVGVNGEIVEDNIIDGNVVTGGGQEHFGTIAITAKLGFFGQGNMVTNNRVNQTGLGFGIMVDKQKYATVAGNHVSLNRNSSALETVVQVYLASTVDSVVRANTLTNPATSGTNVGLRGIQEDAASDRNVIVGNTIKHDTTLLSSSTEIVQLGGAASLIGVEVGEYVAATTLGTVKGKVEVRDGKGAIKGYVPVYGSIT